MVEPRRLFIEVTPDSWAKAKTLGQQLYMTCIFRGMKKNSWRLQTSIERTADKFNIPMSDLWEREKEILREFKARAHHYIQSPPEDVNNIEWLSIIQHYGGPTRLLDFTKSFYASAFFAVDNAEDDACIWAINRAFLTAGFMKSGLDKLVADKKYSLEAKELTEPAELFVSDASKRESIALAVIPTRLNERLAVQKGLFLFPCDIETSFVRNLCIGLNLPFESLESENAEQMVVDDMRTLPTTTPLVWKINLPQKIHPEIIHDLYSMNIDAASLFPGLDGFAKSLSYSVHQAKPTLQRLSLHPINGADKT